MRRGLDLAKHMGVENAPVILKIIF
ncbi:uncharacterized protein G2W53_031681 [Senna tora]|uniref:Uncharacterized protein n=1 Tax=Senna tora TaxID=362788 RepID=A0A834TB91_9FABA|nr:uncharacterized protein G2W53_031681 [Senna tora]